jgi:hypothetical protein
MILMQNNVTFGAPGPGLSVTSQQLGPHHQRADLCQQQQMQRVMCERFPVPPPQSPSQPPRLAPLNVSVALMSHRVNAYYVSFIVLQNPVAYRFLSNDKDALSYTQHCLNFI